MNLIFNNSLRHENSFSREKNPYRFSVRTERVEQNVLSWFYRLSEPFFSREIMEEEDNTAEELSVYRKDRLQTMEWNLDQSTVSLLVHDLRAVSQILTPAPVRRFFRDIRNYVVIFISTDDIAIEEALSSLPAEEQGRVIIMQQRSDRMQSSALKLMARSSRNVIHFSDAMRIIMLRSIHKMKKLPGLFASLPLRKYVAERLERWAFFTYKAVPPLVKKNILYHHKQKKLIIFTA
jgi:hypothetical protein